MMHQYGNGDRNSLKRHRAPQDRQAITADVERKEENQELVILLNERENIEEALPSWSQTHLFTHVSSQRLSDEEPPVQGDSEPAHVVRLESNVRPRERVSPAFRPSKRLHFRFIDEYNML